MVHQNCLSAASTALATLVVAGCAWRGAPADIGAGTPLAARTSCSACAVTTDGHTVFGANLDYREHCRGQLFVNKRGVLKTGLTPGTSGIYASWTSRYASVTFNFVGYQFAWAGMNEAGLVLSTMALPQTACQSADHRPVVDSGLWIQYVLDTCATVDDVVAVDRAVRNVTVDHYLVADRSGAVAAIEYLNGSLVVHSTGETPVRALTNSTYEQSVATWLARRDSGDYSRLTGSLQRFCLAADLVTEFEPSSDEAAVAYVFDTLDTIAGERFSEHASQWSLVFDTKNLRAYFRTYSDPGVRYLDLPSFPPHCYDPVVMLDIDAPLVGDVAPAFGAYSHDAVRDHVYWFIDFWETDVSRPWVDSVIAHLESFSCAARSRRRGASTGSSVTSQPGPPAPYH